MQIGRTVSRTNFEVTDIKGTKWGWTELIGDSTELIGDPAELPMDAGVIRSLSHGMPRVGKEMGKKITCKYMI